MQSLLVCPPHHQKSTPEEKNHGHYNETIQFHITYDMGLLWFYFESVKIRKYYYLKLSEFQQIQIIMNDTCGVTLSLHSQYNVHWNNTAF